MTNKEIKAKLKSIKNDFVSTYNQRSQASWEAHVKGLEPGWKAPQKGRFFTVEDRQTFSDFAAQQRSKMQEIVSSIENEVSRRKSDAPSTEAVNAITLLNMRDNVTSGDIEAAAARYGDNYTAYKAIQEIGRKHKVWLPEVHEVEALEDGLSSVTKVISSMTPDFAENGRWSAGYSSMIDIIFDQAFPD